MNVLIVDDDRAIQRLLADTLRREGFSVWVERDGEWALETFERTPFDLVLLDLLLPSMSGYEVLAKLRAHPRGRQVPVVVVSGVYTSPDVQHEVVHTQGAFAFLEKPFRTSELRKTLRQALRGRYPVGSSGHGEDGPTQRTPGETPTGETPTVDGSTKDSLADTQAEDEQEVVERTVRAPPVFPALNGELRNRPFPEILAEIYRWKASGALLLKREQVKKIVFFREGMPYSVKSNLLSECLGRVMVRERMISQAHCEESLERMKSSGRLQGTVLIEMGCISPHNLVYALKLQLQRKLFDIFKWVEGAFQFNPHAELPAETVQLEMTCAQVIYEGVRRSYDEARLLQVLGDSVDARYVFPAEHPLYALQDAGLGEEEQQLLQAADGHKTVATLRALALLGPQDTLRFLYAMACAQVVELRDRSAEGKPRASLYKLAAEVPKPPPLRVDPPLPPPIPAAPKVPHTGAPLLAPPQVKPGKVPLSSQGPAKLLPELSGVHGTAPEGQPLREQLLAKIHDLRTRDYFGVLEVSPQAGREDIKRAYFALAKAYHPDRHFGSASAEIRQLAAQIYERVSRAHDVLTDPEARARYEQERSLGQAGEVGDTVGKILAAEGKFQRGEELLRQRDYRAAHRTFQEAIALYDQEGEFHAYFGWSLFQSDPQNAAVVDTALRALERAVVLNPKSDKSFLFTGYIYKATGRPDKAEKQFEKAIQANPDCTEALRELRLLGHPKR